VVRLVTEGLSNPDIANRLFISRATVKTHLAHVFTKLDVINRAQLVALATRAAAENTPAAAEPKTQPAAVLLAERAVTSTRGSMGHQAASWARQPWPPAHADIWAVTERPDPSISADERQGPAGRTHRRMNARP